MKKTLPYWAYKVEKLYHSPRVCEMCRMPYPGHPKGCPNYGDPKKAYKCPPFVPYITDVLDFNHPMFLVHSEFNLELHASRMKTLHPNWSEVQARCVLYWQNRSRKQLSQRTTMFQTTIKANFVSTVPEGRGVNVYATARHAGLKLERIKDITICKHVALIGWKKPK